MARLTSDLSIGDRIAIARRIEVPERDCLVVEVTDLWEGDKNGWDLDVRHPTFRKLAWRRRREIFDIVATQRPPGGRRFRAAVWSRVRANVGSFAATTGGTQAPPHPGAGRRHGPNSYRRHVGRAPSTAGHVQRSPVVVGPSRGRRLCTGKFLRELVDG